MNKDLKINKQPLGSSKQLEQIISNYPQQLTLQQTRRLSIIYAKKKIQMDIPIHWTINKVKCLMCTHFSILNMEKFEFQCNKLLIPGKTHVANLPGDQLIVTQADCPKSFQNYYKETMKKVFQKHNINTKSTLYPITHKAFQIAIQSSLSKQRQKNLQQVPLDRQRQRGDQQDQGVVVINIFRVFGIIFMANLIFSFASYWQIGVLITIGCIYYLIDQYVQGNQRRRRQAQRQARRQGQLNRRLDGLNRRQEVNPQQNNQRNQPNQPQQLNQRERRNIFQNQENQNIKKEGQLNKIQQVQQEPNNGERSFKLNQQFQQVEEKIESEKIKPPRRVFQAKIKLWIAFTVEAIYCYILSIFPNWTIQVHLHANQQKMDRVMDEVKLLDPQASQQIKKWQIKQKNQEQKSGNQEQKVKND